MFFIEFSRGGQELRSSLQVPWGYIYIYTFKLYMPYTWTSFGASELLIRIYSELVLYWVEVA